MDKIEEPNRSTHQYSYIILDREAKNRQWRKDSIFNEYAAKTRCPHAENKIQPVYSSLDKNISSKWIKDIDPESEMLKMLDCNRGYRWGKGLHSPRRYD